MAYFAHLTSSDPTTNAKGAKTCQLLNDGSRYHYSAGFTRAPFGPSSFDKDPVASCQNLELRASGVKASFPIFRPMGNQLLCLISATLLKTPFRPAEHTHNYLGFCSLQPCPAIRPTAPPCGPALRPRPAGPPREPALRPRPAAKTQPRDHSST